MQQNGDIEPKLYKLEQLCQKFYEENVLIVAAAGNGGPRHRSISLLGDSKYVLAVGCNDGKYKFPHKKMCAEYSGRGPGRSGVKKPDIVAPGTAIMSCANYGRAYLAKSGTSMAVPIVSGTAALALSKYPEWDVEQCMRKLLYTAIDLGEEWQKQGYGMVNVKGLLT
jgi:serine protease AprX